jgi:MerR family copper efflux transcriptional regulator
MIFIGEASKRSSASIKAIRHYENIGLLPNLGRSGTYRTFTKHDIHFIKLIKEAQKSGFKLAEFKAFFESNGNSSWTEIAKQVRFKESQIEKEIAILKEKQLRLKQYSTLILDCLAEDPDCSKPLLEQITLLSPSGRV